MRGRTHSADFQSALLSWQFTSWLTSARRLLDFELISQYKFYMWQTYIFGMHWKHGGKMYYDELSGESQDEAAGYFIDHCREDVSLVRVQLVGPDEGGVREYAHSPFSPFDPLRARRRTDVDEDAR
jgi:hypothetical protein